MAMFPRDHGYKVEHQNYYYSYEDKIFDEDDYYNGGSSMQMMKHNQPLPKHGHIPNQGHVHGGYDKHGMKGHESNVTEHYETWQEEDWRRDGWSMKDNHYHHGGNLHSHGEHPHKEGGMKYGVYGAGQGHYGPRREFSEYHREERKKAPVWESKGIID